MDESNIKTVDNKTLYIKTVQIIFFSGTGGTRRVANAFKENFSKHNISCNMMELGDRSLENYFNENADFYIMLYPVYAFDAPKIIYDWIDNLNANILGKKAAVISVSGGGEVWPNTGCRNSCCEKLEKKGFNVVYDKMMCMPPNMLTKPNDNLIMHLINIIPQKVNYIVNDIVSGDYKKTNFKKSIILKKISDMEQKHAYKFADKLKINDNCRACKWCENNCPTENIKIDEKTLKPVFKNKCIGCLRCVYGCPFKAIEAKNNSVFKEGFNLDEVEKRMKDKELEPIEKCCTGPMFKGLKIYLEDINYEIKA